MNLSETIQAMRRAGIDSDTILDVVSEIEDARLAKQRARTAKCRTNKKNGNVTSVTPVTGITKKEAVSPRPPSEEKNTPLTPPTGAFPPSDFERLWRAWVPWKTPKGSKRSAESEFDRHIRKAGLDPGMVLAQAVAYCDECRHTDTKTQHVERWIKKHRWEDERLPKETMNGTGRSENRKPSPHERLYAGFAAAVADDDPY